MLTKRDFEAIAEIIKNEYGPNQTIRNIAIRLAHYFKQENPRFDHKRFLKACGVQE